MIRSLQIVDTLNVGGAERMAVNMANSLSNYNVDSHICATRSEGKLKGALNSNVHYLLLKKKSVLDFKAILRLRTYIKRHRINILHAHGTSFFIATLIKCLIWNVKVIWHDHYGNRVNDKNKLKLIVLKLCSFNFSIVYCVNEELRDWAIKNIYCKRVKFISNFPSINKKKETNLKGNEGKRILCAANLRSPKNHKLLFSAFRDLNEEFKEWSLHCIGSIYNDDYSKNLNSFIKENKLENKIFLYGAKEDVSHIISQCDIGVLSSSYEGLPMVLLEYGLGKLAVISTDVGYCAKLIPDDTYGILVPNNDIDALRDGLKAFMSNVSYRESCAEKYNRKVVNEFSESKVSLVLVEDYQSLIASKS